MGIIDIYRRNKPLPNPNAPPAAIATPPVTAPVGGYAPTPNAAPVTPTGVSVAPAGMAVNPNQQAQNNAKVLAALIQLAAPHIRSGLQAVAPIVAPGGVLGLGDAATGVQNRAAGAASDANAQRNEAVRDEAARMRAAGAAQHTAMIQGDAQQANARTAAVVAGRSPEGVVLNPRAPIMTAMQAQGMGLKHRYDGAVPQGFSLVGSNLKRTAPPTTVIDGQQLADAQAKLGPSMTPDQIKASQAKTAATKQTIDAAKAAGTYGRYGGQRANETDDQFKGRMTDIANANIARTPSGKIVDMAGTVGGQGILRAQIDTQIAQQAMQNAPKPTSERDQAEIEHKRALAIKHMQDANRPDYGPMDLVYKDKLAGVDAELNHLYGVLGNSETFPAERTKAEARLAELRTTRGTIIDAYVKQRMSPEQLAATDEQNPKGDAAATGKPTKRYDGRKYEGDGKKAAAKPAGGTVQAKAGQRKPVGTAPDGTTIFQLADGTFEDENGEAVELKD